VERLATPKVWVRLARRVVHIRVHELLLVAIGRAQHAQHQVAVSDPRASDLEAIAGSALGCHLNWTDEAQQLLDHRLRQARVVMQCTPLHRIR
jgi:hypothetical protein